MSKKQRLTLDQSIIKKGHDEYFDSVSEITGNNIYFKERDLSIVQRLISNNGGKRYFPLHVPIHQRKTKHIDEEVSSFIRQNYFLILNDDGTFSIKGLKGKPFPCTGKKKLIPVNGKNYAFRPYILAMWTLFYEELNSSWDCEKMTVDHINGDHSDNRITNLQFLSVNENSVKYNKTAIRKKSLKIRPIEIFEVRNKETSNIWDVGDVVHNPRLIADKLNVPIANVYNSLKQGTFLCKRYKIRYIDYVPEIDETILAVPCEPKPGNIGFSDVFCDGYKFTNKGRYIDLHGGVSYGSTNTARGNIHPRIALKKRDTSILFTIEYHKALIWFVYGVDLGHQGIICHDDNAPKREDGAVRNWLTDLRFGTYSENTRDMILDRYGRREFVIHSILPMASKYFDKEQLDKLNAYKMKQKFVHEVDISKSIDSKLRFHVYPTCEKKVKHSLGIVFKFLSDLTTEEQKMLILYDAK